MSKPVTASEHLAALRRRAAARLRSAPDPSGAQRSASDALAVLHDLASSPDTAADALALLHELQVHQVELDLQAEELRESRAALEAEVRRQTELYESQPVGCFTIDRSLVVHELNPRAARMLGIAREDAYGLALDGFLAPGSGRALRELIARVEQGAAGAAATLELMAKDALGRTVQAWIGADPASPRFLMVWADPVAGPDAQAANQR